MFDPNKVVLSSPDVLIQLHMRSSICTVTGAYSRWTIRSNSRVDGYYVYAGTSERTAGAIDSLVWRDKEFINNYDHGRQLQVHVKRSQRKCRLMLMCVPKL